MLFPSSLSWESGKEWEQWHRIYQMLLKKLKFTCNTCNTTVLYCLHTKIQIIGIFYINFVLFFFFCIAMCVVTFLGLISAISCCNIRSAYCKHKIFLRPFSSDLLCRNHDLVHSFWRKKRFHLLRLSLIL